MLKESDSENSSAVDDSVVVLANGIKVLNSSPHPFVFDDGSVVASCGATLNAAFVESEAPFKDGTMSEVAFVVTAKMPTEEGSSFLNTVPDGVLVLGSAIAAEAYGFPVVMAIPTAETAGRGVAPADKRMQSGRFTRFLVAPVRDVADVDLDDL